MLEMPWQRVTQSRERRPILAAIYANIPTRIQHAPLIFSIFEMFPSTFEKKRRVTGFLPSAPKISVRGDLRPRLLGRLRRIRSPFFSPKPGESPLNSGLKRPGRVSTLGRQCTIARCANYGSIFNDPPEEFISKWKEDYPGAIEEANPFYSFVTDA
jgi:hypothetical protein